VTERDQGLRITASRALALCSNNWHDSGSARMSQSGFVFVLALGLVTQRLLFQPRQCAGPNEPFRSQSAFLNPAGQSDAPLGDEIEFSSTLFTHGRAYHLEWTGKFPLR